MQLSMISGYSPFLAAPEKAAPGSALTATAIPTETFVSATLDALDLIPAAVSPSDAPTRRLGGTSLPVLEAQSWAELASAGAVPGLSLIPLAKDGDKAEILALFDGWNAALKTRDPEKVLAHYAPDAILLPTLSNKVRHNHEEIRDYFEHFLAKGPQGKIDESNVRTFGDIAINSGIYTFNFANGDAVQARFTYVYRKLDGEWKIVEHHSSAMPEKASHA